MGKSSLNQIAAEVRGEVTDLVTNTRDCFAHVAQFVAEVNEAVGSQVFCYNEEVGVVWFFIYRTGNERDQYKIDKLGTLTRTRDGDHLSSEDWRFREFSCTPGEFAGAMARCLEMALRQQEKRTDRSKALANRIHKPIIEVGRRMQEGKWAARLASEHGIWDHGSDPFDAVRQILISLPTHGLSGIWEDYTVILLPSTKIV